MKRWVSFFVVVGPFIALLAASIAYGLTFWHFSPIPRERFVELGVTLGVVGAFFAVIIWLFELWDGE
jgi:uncharacterized membrane protein